MKTLIPWLLLLLPLADANATLPPEVLAKARLPKGFAISLLTDQVPDAREMALGPQGTLFVGTKEGSVYAIPHATTTPGPVRTLLRGLNMPNGVAVHDGALYVAEISRIQRFDAIESHLSAPPKPVALHVTYPSDTHHGWKYIAFGPDGMLYVPVGAPCNVCEKENPLYASMTRIRGAGSDRSEPRREIVAKGIRNSVGFDWDPATHELWFTDNGRDLLGDDFPPDELNHLTKVGMDFGFPYCHGMRVPDPEFGRKKDCAATTPPAQPLGPHVASLGMKFYTGRMFPPEYRGRVFVAEHGSWNRSQPIGYRISTVRVEGGKASGYETFLDGWLQGSKRFARPVDVLVMPDGSLLVSDDMNGAIYRITYK